MILAVKIGIFVFLLILGAILLLGSIGALVFITLRFKESKENEDALENIALDNADDDFKMKQMMASKHSITFNSMGIVDNPKTIYGIESIPEELPFLRVDGYQFLGWSMNFEYMVPVVLGAKLEADITVFAMWKMLEPEENLDEPDEEDLVDEPLDLELHDDKNDDDIDEDDAVEEEVEDSEVEESSPEVIYNEEKHEYVVVRYKRTYEGRMCNLPNDVLRYYNIVKNKILSYNTVWQQTKAVEKFKYNNKLVAQLKPLGKGIALYLALTPDDIDMNKYKARDVSNVKAYRYTPIMVRARNDRRCKYMLQLIDKLMTKLSLELVKESKENFAKKYTSITKEKQLELGWLIEKTEKVEKE